MGYPKLVPAAAEPSLPLGGVRGTMSEVAMSTSLFILANSVSALSLTNPITLLAVAPHPKAENYTRAMPKTSA